MDTVILHVFAQLHIVANLYWALQNVLEYCYTLVELSWQVGKCVLLHTSVYYRVGGSCTWWSRQQALWLQRRRRLQVLVVPESLMQQWLKLSPLCPLRRTSLAMIPWGTLLCRSLRSGNIHTIVKARRFLPNCWNWKNMKMDIRYTLGQKPTFYPEIPLILIFQKC